MNSLSSRPIDILIVEDNEGDARLVKEALKGKMYFNSVHIVKDGLAAMDFLYKRGEYSKINVPDLIFLDLNLPGIDGREILAEIKSSEKFKQIPVVIMTASQAEEDILRSYDLHANCYIKKPLDMDQFINVVESLEDFWLSVVKLPPKE